MAKHLVLILILTGFALSVTAQTDQPAPTEVKEPEKNFLYQWTDERGLIHITDGLDKIPKQYRNKAVKLEQPKKEDTDQGQQARPERPYQSGADTGAIDAAKKAAWQQRMSDARQRVVDAEKRYQELAQKRDELLQSWGGSASGRLDTRLEADKVEQEMKDAQREVDEARHDLDVVIPENARKSGVPPGWLRE